MRLNLGIRRRLAPLLDGDRRKIELLNSILFTLPGSPIIYYGDEIGMGDNIWLKDRDGVRTPMQWNAGKNAGFSEASPQRLFSQPIESGEFDYQTVNVENQLGDPGSLLNTIRHMVAVRKEHPAFSLGGIEFIDPGKPEVFCFYRSYRDECILVIHNLSAAQQEISIISPDLEQELMIELLSRQKIPVENDNQIQLSLNPFEYLWIRIR